MEEVSPRHSLPLVPDGFDLDALQVLPVMDGFDLISCPLASPEFDGYTTLSNKPSVGNAVSTPQGASAEPVWKKLLS